LEDLEQSKSNCFKDGVISAVPIIIGFFPIAMAFGLLAKTVNISLLDCFLFSFLVFAGASQFMALDLIKAGIATGDIIIATLLLNLRHIMMSASLSVRIKENKKRWLLFIAFGITDETFAVASLKNGPLTRTFLLVLNGLSYIAWVSGSVVGYLVGAILPITVQSSLGIGLYAMFAAILMPEIRKSLNVLMLSVVSGLIYFTIYYFHLLPLGWDLIGTIILSSGVGLFIIKDEEDTA
jgi:4-azaleucine resistance transporter AzlC